MSKPPAVRKPPLGKDWKDKIPRQGRDPGDYPSVFDELDDSTRDQNVMDGTGRSPGTVQMKSGGKVTRVTGPKRGKEDGLIAVQKGEFVVRKAAAIKYGPAKMRAVNAGTARITVPKGKRR